MCISEIMMHSFLNTYKNKMPREDSVQTSYMKYFFVWDMLNAGRDTKMTKTQSPFPVDFSTAGRGSQFMYWAMFLAFRVQRE
jgi:hypothetical protein